MAAISNVMIIDDDEIHNYLFSKRLTNVGFTDNVIEFTKASDALTYLKNNIRTKENLPDVIFLDLQMPVFDGWDFINVYEELKEKTDKEILLFTLSSSVNPKDLTKAKNNQHVVEYIQKPLMEDELFIMKDRYLRKS